MYTFDDKHNRWTDENGRVANNRSVNAELVGLRAENEKLRRQKWRPLVFVLLGAALVIAVWLLWEPVQDLIGWLFGTSPADLMDSFSIGVWLVIFVIIVFLVWLVMRVRANKLQPAPVTQTVQTTRTVRTTKQEPAPASSDQPQSLLQRMVINFDRNRGRTSPRR